MASDKVEIAELGLKSVTVTGFKRIDGVVHVEFPEQGCFIVGGWNRQGKTSLLQAIQSACAGSASNQNTKMEPVEPINDGGSKGECEVRFRNGLVSRRIHRGSGSVTEVTDSTGKRLGGQAVLADHLSLWALNCGTFLKANDKVRAAALLESGGVSEQLESLEADIAKACAIRLDANSRSKQATARFGAMAKPVRPDGDVPDVKALRAALAEAQEANARRREQHAQAAAVAATVARDRAEWERSIVRGLAEIERLRALILREEEVITNCRDALAKLPKDEQPPEVLSLEDTTAKERAIDAAQTLAETFADYNRAISAYVSAEKDALAYAEEAANAEAAVKALRDAKATLFDEATFPFKGLAVADGVITFNGRPWQDLSDYEQHMIAIGVAHQHKPGMKFVLLPDVSMFDPENTEKLRAWCEKQGLLIVTTCVCSSEDGRASIIMRDGKVVGSETETAKQGELL